MSGLVNVFSLTSIMLRSSPKFATAVETWRFQIKRIGSEGAQIAAIAAGGTMGAKHGYAGSELLHGLKEFMCDLDGVAGFIGVSSVLVARLAPISRPMLERLTNLKFVAASRGAQSISICRPGSECFGREYAWAKRERGR